jgi:hypothetical protein
VRRALPFLPAAVALLALFSCQRGSPGPTGPQPEVADARSAFAIVADLPLWDLADGKPTWKGSLTLGQKVALTGKSDQAVQSGRQRELLQVRLSSGQEGWVRSEYVVASSILGVTVGDGALIYSEPANTAATADAVARMTVLAIHADSAVLPFIRVSFYDPGSRTLFAGVYLRNEGVSTRKDDVQGAILYLLAASSKNDIQKEAFLSSAIKDHPGSAFLPQIQAALAAVAAPGPSGGASPLRSDPEGTALPAQP